MKNLTREILQEEGDKFFPEIKASFDSGATEDYVGSEETTIIVFPGYKERKRNGTRDTLSEGCKSTGWVMQSYISKCMGLAYHMLNNGYPTTQILAMLPKGFSERVAERLKK
jgi:hypothetical protein